MKITIDIPDIPLTEYIVFDVLEKANFIPENLTGGWVSSFEDKKKTIELTVENAVDGELISETIFISKNTFYAQFLSQINHFEYDGRYGTSMEITSEDKPSFSFYRKEGNILDFFKTVLDESLRHGYSYGYIE